MTGLRGEAKARTQLVIGQEAPLGSCYTETSRGCKERGTYDSPVRFQLRICKLHRLFPAPPMAPQCF